MGLQGKGEIWSISEKWKRDFPLPLHQQRRSLAGFGLVVARALVLRTPEGAGHDVEMVADEVFCKPPRMEADRGVPLATNSKHKHSMFKHRLSSNGNALCLQDECSDDVWIIQDPAIRISREQSQPLHDM
jgi:hypothetical protein